MSAATATQSPSPLDLSVTIARNGRPRGDSSRPLMIERSATGVVGMKRRGIWH
jgi:hypothetical protein